MFLLGLSIRFWFSDTVVVSWNGCEPACGSRPPPSSSATSAKLSIPNGVASLLTVSGRVTVTGGVPPPEIVTSLGSPEAAPELTFT